MGSMNKKLMIIPTIVLSSALLLTGCTSGNTEPGSVDSSNPSSSSSSSDPSGKPTGNAGYIAPPNDLKADYKGYYYAPSTVVPEAWEYYKSTGATTYKEDSSARSTSPSDWDSARSDQKDFQRFDKMYGEVSSDVEQSALKVSSHLEANSSASVEELNNKELVINRYPELGKTVVEKDSSTGFYFVIFTVSGGSAKDTAAYGILVPQKGITPDFSETP